MPPRTIIQVPSEPGSRHMLWTRKLWPAAGRVRSGGQARQAVGDGVHRRQQLALEAEPVEVVRDRARHQVDEGRAQRGPDVALGGVGSTDIGSASQAGARSSRNAPISAASRSLGGDVVGDFVAAERRAATHRAGSARRWSGGSSADRAAATGRSTPSSSIELGRHQPEQVGTGRLAELRDLAERLFGAGGSAEHVRLHDQDIEAGPSQQHCRDKAVVAGADHHDVSVGGKRRIGVGRCETKSHAAAYR